MKKVNIFWFRRDIRLHDNRGLLEALSSGVPILPIFIFDKHILSKLPQNDHRVSFIHYHLCELNDKLTEVSSGLQVYFGNPEDVYKELTQKWEIEAVFANHDYEPYAIERDEKIRRYLEKEKIQFKTFKDQVIFEKDEVVKDNGQFYSVYTPYSNKWKEQFKKVEHFHSEKKISNFLKIKSKLLSLEDIGFQKSDILFPSKSVKKEIFIKYAEQRDFPEIEGTSRLGVHLRFGTVSIRDCVEKALELKSKVWLSELIWREFFMQILWHNPHVVNEPFKPQYKKIKWNNNEKDFEAWCLGKTGYPIVDAGMRELNSTGHMHNRVRMIVGSFLVKHLLIDWRWGEKYFSEKLFDFDLSANNGNWQWVAGCGCDAAPYFRIFNPEAQTAKFDKNHKYIKKWVPEYQSLSYVKPIIEHSYARTRCLRAYEVVKS